MPFWKSENRIGTTKMAMFNKILIANRGEIACRIIQTAHRLSIKTVSIYSEPDALARHVELADEAYLVGPATARESYLNSEKIIEAAIKSNAITIHPGYGFLSENADFAEACADAGLTFIGPPPNAIRAMGSKSAAKQIMEKANIPMVPGYFGDDQNEQTLLKQAKQIGYPLLIKAAAGGGGKGMRVVNKANEFNEALLSAKREAASAFADDHILLEKYLAQARHIEIQIFRDNQGNTVTLFERDCSIQRRYQKVLEEAPAPGMTIERRQAMGDTAMAVANAIEYVGAGTVEFIVDGDDHFYFMEMNTRLQVEHPVTEMITGQDLVEWQLRIASGEPLPCSQKELAIHGHAMEVRLYAEDPSRDFLPATGHLSHLHFPSTNSHLRIDTGVRQGDEISIHYDPLLAKIIVWDLNREDALRRLHNALEDTEIIGVTTNIHFLNGITTDPEVASGKYDTGSIGRLRQELFTENSSSSNDTVLAIACLHQLVNRAEETTKTLSRSQDPYSPWHLTNGWRLNEDNYHSFDYHDGKQAISVTVHFRKKLFIIDLPGGSIQATAELDKQGALVVNLDGIRLVAKVIHHGNYLSIFLHGHQYSLALHDPSSADDEEHEADGMVVSPMPGRVVEVKVRADEWVERGQALMVLEAMKMEHTIVAPDDGKIIKLHYQKDDLVDEGVELIDFEPKLKNISVNS